MRDRLIELLAESAMNGNYLDIQHVADHLLSNDVIVLPCDVVEVVRCRDCTFFEPFEKVEDFDGRCVFRGETDREEFCSFGARKESKQ